MSALIVGLGGTVRSGSFSERVLRYCLDAAAALGADTRMFAAQELQLELYRPEREQRSDAARALVDALRRADGLVLVSPGYHGGVSGMLKNAIDYVEDLREDERPYLDGRAVGCIACASGWQATTTTLMALRAIVHALRGWPTPLGVTLNSREPAIDADGRVVDADAGAQLELVAHQVVEFARLQAAARRAGSRG